MTIREITQESYSDFRKISIEASRQYNPQCGTVDLPSIEILRENGIKLMMHPVETDDDGRIFLAVSRLHTDYASIDWSQWSILLAVVHRQIEGGFEQLIVRGVLKNDFS